MSKFGGSKYYSQEKFLDVRIVSLVFKECVTDVVDGMLSMLFISVCNHSAQGCSVVEI